MAIETGATIPAVTLHRIGEGGRPEPVSSADVFAGRKVILVSVPGAFTPTCSTLHLPDFVQNAAAIRDKGADEIVFVAVNDPWVMKAWGEAQGVGDSVTLLSDGNGDLTRALGIEADGSPVGLGTRGKRAMFLVDDNVVKAVEIEEKRGAIELTGANSCMSKL